MTTPNDDTPPLLVLLGAVLASFGLVGGAILFVALKFDALNEKKIVGLPVLAIVGIMVLFGTLALVAIIFKSVKLANVAQPLALPQGSIRAAIALSLVVLFAVIAIMLFQSTQGQAYAVRNLTAAEHAALVEKAFDRITMVVQDCRVPPEAVAGAATGAANKAPQVGGGAFPAPNRSAGDTGPVAATDAGPPSPAPCPEGDLRYTVYLLPGSSPESADLAKQLLGLIGTLMASVTGFYFGARSADSAARKNTKAGDQNQG